MQITMAILALALSAGFIFWAAVMANLIGEGKFAFWIGACLIAFAVAAIAFAFLAGRVWP